MTKTQIKPGVELNQSGSKQDIKVTPKFWLESIRKLDNVNGEKGTKNAPHAHVKIKFGQR